MKSRVVSATEFKAKCLALLDEIDHQGGTVTVTKRGRPMAMVGPVRNTRCVDDATLGEADEKSFFITARGLVYRVRLDVKGAGGY